MTTHIDPSGLSHEEVLLLSTEQRIQYVEKIRVIYPRWQAIYNRIEECHKNQAYAAEPPCLLIAGPTGAGKTKMVEQYQLRYPGTTTQFGKKVPILFGSIPSSATISSLLTALLKGLGDPRPDRGTIDGKTLRLTSLIDDCGVTLFVLDELQHFYDQDSNRILLNVSNWLKTLIKDTGVACVLVGLQGQANQVVDANPQLARLFGDPEILTPFRWDYSAPETIIEFRMFLLQLQKLLPLRESAQSKLAVVDRAIRCFVATDGLMAHIMKLIRGATAMALLQGQEYLTDELLSEAFVKYLAPKRRDIPNPFIGDKPDLREQKPASTPEAAAPTTNRRGQTRRSRALKTSDIVRG